MAFKGFVNQRENPSWGTQFWRSVAQMIPQAIIGGGTNLLQNVIMSNIRNKAMAEEGQKQREFQDVEREEERDFVGDIRRQQDMTQQIANLREQDRFNQQKEMVAPMAAAQTVEKMGMTDEANALRSMGRKWGSPEQMIKQAAPAVGMAGASEVAPAAAFFPRPEPTLPKEGYENRFREWFGGLPPETKAKAETATQTAFERSLPGRKELASQKASQQLELMQQRLSNQLLYSVFKGDISKREQAWKMAQDLIRKAQGETPESIYQQTLPNPQIPKIPGAKYPLGQNGPQASPEDILNKWK